MLMSTLPSSNFQKIIRSNQNETFTFSIIIPSYNNLSFLKKCIESISKMKAVMVPLNGLTTTILMQLFLLKMLEYA
jgi:hypothetical protein